MVYQCIYFKPEELAPPLLMDTIAAKGLPREYVYRLFDGRLLMLLDYIRLEYGPTTVNNWADGGDRWQSGIRTPDMGIYSMTSQHAYGRATDSINSQVAAEDIRRDFKLGAHDDFLKRCYIQVTFESGVNWLHMDTRNNDNLVNFF